MANRQYGAIIDMTARSKYGIYVVRYFFIVPFFKVGYTAGLRTPKFPTQPFKNKNKNSLHNPQFE